MEKIMKFIKDEDGAASIEYAIIIGVIVVGSVAILGSIGQWVIGRFTALDTELGTAP